MPLTRFSLGTGLALVASLALALPALAATRPCARMVVVDGLADPGTLQPAGAVIDVVTSLPPDSNAQVVGGIGPSAFLAGIAASEATVFVSDVEADPSGLGPDANGNPGRGAVFRLDAAGALALVADGTGCDGALPGCGPGGVFVDPLGLAWSPRDGRLIVADLDADPSALGEDSHSFAGHGAIFAVDPATGAVSLVADGSIYFGPIPGGAPSIFEDPLAVAVASDGMIFVADQLSTPLRDSGVRSPGAVFRVDARGTVTLVAVIPGSRGLRDVAVEPTGTLLVLDRLVGGGTVFRVDPTLPPQANVVGSFVLPDLVDAQGLVVEGNGTIHVVDASADPLDTSSGALFTIDPAFTAATPLSTSPVFASPWGLDLLGEESLDTAFPASGVPDSSLTVTLTGGVYEPGAVVDFGPNIVVDAVRVISPTVIEADITIPVGTAPQLVDVRVTNPIERTWAFHCEIFEVRASGGCVPANAIDGTLRLRKLEQGAIELRWDGTGDACASSFRVRRAVTPHPDDGDGTWPTDPAFADITAQDGDLTPLNERYEHAITPDPLELFLVTEVGPSGEEGPSGHYGG